MWTVGPGAFYTEHRSELLGHAEVEAARQVDGDHSQAISFGINGGCPIVHIWV